MKISLLTIIRQCLDHTIHLPFSPENHGEKKYWPLQNIVAKRVARWQQPPMRFEHVLHFTPVTL